MMGLVGIAGVAAIVGGALYICITVGSLLWENVWMRDVRAAEVHADSADYAGSCSADLRLCWFRSARNVHAGDGVLVSPLFCTTTQPEVSVARSGPEPANCSIITGSSSSSEAG